MLVKLRTLLNKPAIESGQKTLATVYCSNYVILWNRHLYYLIILSFYLTMFSSYKYFCNSNLFLAVNSHFNLSLLKL